MTEHGPASRRGPAGTAGSLAVWAAWLLATALWTPLVLLAFLATAWWDRRRAIAGRTFRIGARVLLLLNPWWRVRIEGTLPPRDLRPFVAVCNHESLADIVLVGTLPWDMKWLSKASIVRMPFLGWMMRLAGDVSVRRGDADSRTASYARLKTWVERGASVMIFPEGTRSRTPELLPFRSGAFRLALETGRPILPIAVSGTRDAIRKGSMRFGRADVRLRVLPPVSVSGRTLDDLADLRDEVRSLIEAARDSPPAS
ncbi:MAG: lysophospholipid acyltransferase family protein [Gemmatimonadota bacterium]|nr:lysophospholipid acyltransferase family protein [Gemmatimonadota bacterium]